MAGAAGAVLFVVGVAIAPAGRSAATTTSGSTATTTTSAATTTTPVTTAPPPPTTIAPPPTTIAPPTTAPPTTTVTVPAPSPTTTLPATTAPKPPATTRAATTTARSTPKPKPKPAPARVRATTARAVALSSGCPVAAVVLLIPHRDALVVGPLAVASAPRAELPRIDYRSGGGIVTSSAAGATERRCTSRGPAGARAAVRSLSLFGGAVTARRVLLTRTGVVAAAVAGLEVEGKAVTAHRGAHVIVPGVGYLVAPAAPVRLSAASFVNAGLAVHVTRARYGLPAGTVVLVAATGLRTARPAHEAKGRHRKHAVASGRPLTVTPPLALRHYVFPVAGPADFGDSYGGFRSDVAGNWHHGDDIFAPLGTPVVAVASGTLNRVGWEKIGGWRLWVRDSAGDEFYYAHLSGYAPTDLRSNRVKAGEVIGFVGNTGDAFTTPPHLHFEIHPRTLLHLGYDGAVDPTTYIERWPHLGRVVAPRPVHPPLPTQPQIRSEARYVFRELLAARHLVAHAPSVAERPHVRIPAGAGDAAPALGKSPRKSASVPAVRASSSRGFLTAFAAALGAAAVAGIALFVVDRRRRQSPTSAT
jgi:murein DD-endopeptidase MepM/ murein hydrolase activator NlpD